VARAKVNFRGCARQKKIANRDLLNLINVRCDFNRTFMLYIPGVPLKLLTETSQGKKLKTREMILAACVDFLKKG
jgi:hypothetical protein